MLRRSLVLSFVFSIVIAAMPLAVAQADCDFSYSNYARAVQLQDMGDYTRALRHYHCALRENPDDAIIPILIDNVYEDIANASSAWSRERDVAGAVACDPALDHAMLGGEAHEAGDDNLALIHLHCVLSGDPTRTDALYRMGMIHINRGETHEAKHYFDRADRAASRVGDEDLLVYLLGNDARSVLKQVDLDALAFTSPDPGETGEYFPPGQVYLSIWFSQAWSRRRDRDTMARQPAEATSRESITNLQLTLRQEPTRVDLRCELGRRYSARGDYAAAYFHFSYLIRETLGDHCGSEESSVAVAHASARAVELPVPVSPAEKAVAEGTRYMTAGKLYIAANIFLQALDLDPLHRDARCRLGMIYSEWANYRGALDQFEFVLQRDPQNRCARQNRTIAARDMLAILTPLVVDDYFHYARTYIRMGEWELARDAFLKGLAIDPARSDVRCELGMLYAQLGDDRAALNEFDRALIADDRDSCAWSNRDALLQRQR